MGVVRDHEIRRVDAVVGQHFLGERLVLAEQQGVGAGAGVAHLHEIQQGRDVGLMRAVVMERFGEIEDQVGRVGGQLFDDGGDVIEDGEGFDVVAEARQTFEHRGFGGLVLFLQRLGRKLLAGIDGVGEVEESENLHG